MESREISIWFFIGVLLFLYGGMIFGYGLYEWASGVYPPGVRLTNLHTPVWWGGFLFLVGIFYSAKFRPNKSN